MPRIAGTTDAQSAFLRSFRDSNGQPPVWPALRRWLRRPAFVAALTSLRATLQFAVDFNLATAAAHASKLLALDPGASDVKRLADLLRLAHLRQRFAVADAPALKSPATFALRQEINDLHEQLAEIDEEERYRSLPEGQSEKKEDPNADLEGDRQQYRDRLAELEALIHPPCPAPPANPPKTEAGAPFAQTFPTAPSL